MNFSIAVISDIHGNSFALKAVLEEIVRRKISRVINCGDTFYGPLDIPGTYALLQACPLEYIHLRGNGERLLLSPADEADTPTLSSAKSCLSEDLKMFLTALPRWYAEEYLYACHGSPQSDEEYLLEDMHAEGGLLKSTARIVQSLAGIAHKVIVCGHSHVARTVYLPESGQWVVNPGSVGLPAYADTLPTPHIMEAGSPLAQFAVITRQNQCWQVEQVQLSYDWQAASSLAARNGRNDWAVALATGRVAQNF